MTKIFNSDSSSLAKIRSMTEALTYKEHELQKANRRYRAILDHAPFGMLMTSGRTIIDTNKQLHAMLGWTRECLIGQSTRIIYDSEETFQYVGKLLAEDKIEFSCRVNMRHMDGTIKEYTLKVTKISDEENVASIYIEFWGV